MNLSECKNFLYFYAWVEKVCEDAPVDKSGSKLAGSGKNDFSALG